MASLFPKKNGNKELDAGRPSTRAYVAPRQAQTFSEAAANAAQYVVDLENKIHTQQDKLQEFEVRNNLVEEANKMLHEQIARDKAEWEVEMTKLKAERDLYHEQFMAIKTSLEISGSVILNALDAAKEVVTRHTVPQARPSEVDLKEVEERILDQYRPKDHKKFGEPEA